ncbi:2435_t:CDS:2 [Gigaspora rosea]|nr:2435_t:CDS:2 [Gigaspora rosea]
MKIGALAGGRPTNIAQTVFQKVQTPALQVVEPVRQPRGSPSSLQTKKGIENYRLLQYLNNLSIFSTEDFERNYSIKLFQKSRPYRNNISARIDKIENTINEGKDAVNQLTNQFQKDTYENVIFAKRWAIAKKIVPIDR